MSEETTVNQVFAVAKGDADAEIEEKRRQHCQRDILNRPRNWLAIRRER